MKSLRLAFVLLLVLTLLFSVSSNLYASTVQPMVPDYEVKIFMDPSVVLNSDHDLKSSIKSCFGMPSSVTKMSVQYMDSDYLDLDYEGWAARIRKMEGESDFELTYKKRYPIENGNIDAALQTAALDGFDINEDDYEAQVEWGYQKQTLSFSNPKTAKLSGYSGMELPSTSDSRKVITENIPGKLDNWLYDGWGSDILKDAHKYGPVDAKRSIGTWSGMKFYIEVWKIKNEAGTGYDYVVEASFKTNDRSAASVKHDELISYFQSKGWLLPLDQMKTQMILERY